MKKTKFLIALFVALTTLFIGNRAYAYTVTIQGAIDGHTYEAYQIFKGDLYDSTLSNIAWGNGVNASGQTAFGDAAVKAETLVTASDGESFAKDVSQYLQNPLTFTGTTLKVSDPGYYLIKDTDSSLTGTVDKSYTSYIMEVVKDVQVNTKSDTPTVIKKVQDINDSTGVSTDWQDSADYDITDHVPFQLTASLPTDFGKYTEYYLELKDTMSTGLTYDQNAKIFLLNGTDKTDVTSQFTVSPDGSSYKINNLKSIPDVTAQSKIVVEYTATLNDNAFLGSSGNPNSVVLSYSNNPNYTGSGESSSKGETPKDTVIIFTYKVVVNKVDSDNNPLTGAEFTLSKKMPDGSSKNYTAVTNLEGTQFSFKGLDDGNYILTETKTPNGYNSIAPITFTVSATHSVDSADPELTSLNGSTTDGTVTLSALEDFSTLSTNIVNKKGSLLPSTGSIGTRIFSIIGGIFTIVAVILLVTKRRVKNR